MIGDRLIGRCRDTEVGLVLDEGPRNLGSNYIG